MVDVPGTFEHRRIYAIETAPSVGIEVPGTHQGLNEDVRTHPTEPWELALIDGDGGCNAFEAAAKFTSCGVMRYYAGGTETVTTNNDDVLKVFDSMSWIAFAGRDVVCAQCTVQEDVYEYPDPPANPDPPQCP